MAGELPPSERELDVLKVLWEIRHEAERRPELLWIAVDGLREVTGTG